MAIKENPTPPSRSRLIANILLAMSGAFLIVNLFLPNLFGAQVPAVPYSLFIHQVQEGEVSQVSVGQNQIRY